MSRPKIDKPKKVNLHKKRVENPDAKCPKHPKKEWRPFVEAAWAAGWWCYRGRKYIFCYAVDEDESIVKVPMTPSDWRTARNKTRDFRNAGLEL